MAARKTHNFLPTVFQTDTNKKFLSATVDQLVSEPDLQTLYGYIGRQFAPTYKSTDSYVSELTTDRQDYQLEPSLIIRNENKDITFFASYLDLVNKVKYYGGITNNHSRLWEQEYYSFDPLISYDKFVNFSQYYWLPNGPAPVEVSTSGLELTATYNVTRDASNGKYIFDEDGITLSSITLARGGVYNFVIDQPGYPFWIQSELGLAGISAETSTISTRDVFGVTNNGTDVGTITFQVPQTNAQDRYLLMKTVYNVDYATPVPYYKLQNRTVSQFLADYPLYKGITGQLNGKTLIFQITSAWNNLGDTAWTTPVVHDNDGNVISGYDAGKLVPEAASTADLANTIRYGVWKVVYIDAGIKNSDGSDDPLIKLIPVQNVNINEKVYIKYGVANANKEFFKDYDGFFYPQPLLSSELNTLWIQDGTITEIYKPIQIVNYDGWIINIENDILGQQNYTSPNGVEFTTGLKVEFGDDVTPTNYQHQKFYVEGVGSIGSGIRLVPINELVTPEAYNTENAVLFPDSIFPEYITINRGSLDRNAWSRNNRWFHVDVITATAAYNGKQPSFDQAARGQRPIIQFDADTLLFNSGRVGLSPIHILDTTTLSAFTELQGHTYSKAFGVTLVDGMRVIFGADQDPLVRNKIYVVKLVQYLVDTAGLPTGPYHIELVKADDGDVVPYNTVVVESGKYAGSQWWYDGVTWIESQQKTAVQQAPLFEVLDSNGKGFSTYVRSTFVGTKIIGYLENSAGVNDSILGFPLSYRNFNTQGDIEFSNFFNTDTFSFIDSNNNIVDGKINLGYLQKIIDAQTIMPTNTWQTVPENSKQYQQISYNYDGSNSPFVVDITPKDSGTIPYIKVFQNYNYLSSSKWKLGSDNTITLSTTLTVGDQIDILIYSDEVSQIGFYQVPLNLDLNAQNIDIDVLTLGQVRNHLISLSQNSTIVKGNVLGRSNLRDIDIKQQGGTILQHSSPAPLTLFLIDNKANFINSLRHAQQEYTKFKNKFLELSISLPGIDPTDPVSSVDTILTKINIVKNKTFPWYYSDMVPYGPLKNTITYTVFDPLKTSYEITQIFNSQELSNRAVLIYLNGVQLVNNIDFSFSTETPSVAFMRPLTVSDVLTIIEYSNTDGNYIPETPTKLGLWPPYVPEIFTDNTYRTPIDVLRGHDGSITPVFGDYRDDFLLELEKRIFNNIKLPDTGTYGDILSVVPGKFRNAVTTERYTLDEINSLAGQAFLNWIGNNKLDFSTNNAFESNDPFTWNYASFSDVIDGEKLPGSWRACYQYFFDTIRPHITPWEMLGFSTMPSWWIDYYGPGPYTGGNTLLWDDLEAGNIVQGVRAGIDPHYARPGLSKIIPVDENGNLRSPAEIITKSFNGKRAAASWAVGQYGPVEFAWRSSSEFPFAVQQAVALAKPGKYFGLLIDTYNYSQYNPLFTLQDTATGKVIGTEQYLTRATNHHLTQDTIDFNGDDSSGAVYRGAGYINWIAEYLISQGINPSNYITPNVRNFQVNLAYKVAGFTDQKYLQVLAEQVSPTSTNDSILIPNENYTVYLNDTPVPTQKLIYSAVIVEKTTNGYSVRGYDLNNSFFTIIPSVVNNNAYNITVLNKSATIFNNYQNLKLRVPYGFEFTTLQQVADFFISYERYLLSQGFTFEDRDPNLSELRNWKLSVKEFLFWAQQGWKPGSILVLSPVADTINAISINNAITAGIEDSQYGSKVVDQNFNLIKNNNYKVMRTPSTFKLSMTDPASVIGYFEVDLVQYEHSLVFDNTTVFSDVIYKPETGNRQYRLKLIGQKTAAWDGSLSAPGFMYSSGDVNDWDQGKDYLQGDLVRYKNQYYTALQNVVANPTFQFQYWQRISSTQIQKGLLSNFSTLAVEGQSYYDSYAKIKDKDQMAYSHALIGFKPRQYLSDLGLTETTQIEFYKGFIAQKGSANSINQMLKAKFNNLSGDISFYEEWAMRVGEYGALGSNPFVEIALDEKAFSVNPSMAQFVGAAENNLGDGIAYFNQSQLFRYDGTYTGNVALTRTAHSNYEDDVPTAGYVNIDDVDVTIFDLANYVDLDNNIASIGSGYTIWCAKDFTQKWNVYRVTETNNHVTRVANSLNNYITFTTKLPHGFVEGTRTTEGSIFLVKGFSGQFDGFYQVYKKVDNNNVMVYYTGSLNGLTTQMGNGTLYRMDSMRFKYMEDARIYGLDNPPNGWKVGDKIWIDDDAATNAVQGQPYGTQPSGTWKVYEKHHPWEYQQQLEKGSEEYNAGDGYGSSVKMTLDGLVVVSGSPYASNGSMRVGSVSVFLKDYKGQFVESTSIVPLATNTFEFGYTVDLATDPTSNDILAVGAPGSNGSVGHVYIYNKTISSSSFNRSQVLVGPYTGGRFGTSLAFNQNGEWLYIGAPGNTAINSGNVYVYGLNRFITNQQQTVSVTNENKLFFSANITANIGDVITQPLTGAQAIVSANVTNSSNVIISNLTNFLFSSLGNVRINSSDAGFYPTASTSTPTKSSVNLTFTPAVPYDANSLLIVSGTKTFIPNVDYTLSGSTVTFLTGNLNQTDGDVTIIQQPYYTLVKTISMPTGNVGSNFGYALSSSFDGAQLAVGTPGDTVGGASGNLLVGAGSVWVYDRVIEAFETTGDLIYTTKNKIAPVYKVLLDNEEVNNYSAAVGGYTITFTTPPPIGHIIYVEVNQFNILEQLIGVDSLEGGLKAIQANAAFGTSLTICSNNCAIYVGAPNYDKGTEYNSGAVWKFHNRGRLYGTNTGYTVNPVFTPGDSIHLNNFEVTVVGRLMPTKLANGYSASTLTVSSNIRANIGDLITQSLGGGYYANARVLANTAVAGSQTITVTGYTTANTFNYGQSTTGANVVSVFTPVFISNTSTWANTSISTTAYPVASLDSLVQDINTAGILGVSAVNENGRLRLNSDVTVAKDQLRILSGVVSPGSTGVYASGKLIIFAFMQIIVNPYGNPGEYFGSKVKLASNAYMLVIGSSRGTTKEFTTFDATITTNSTIFDQTSTRWFESITGSGSVYIYELYDDPRNAVEHPGRYAFAQQLDPGTLTQGSKFGYALDIEGQFITIAAPGATLSGEPTGSGTVYIFENPARTRGWKLIRYQQPQVDIDSVTRAYLYNNQTKTILDNLQFVDPAKGRILGQAEQDITYKTEYDPAIYNRGSNPAADINTNVYWGTTQVGQVWWDLSQVRYLDYEQDTLTYRSINWGNLFPGSLVEVLEWIESTVLPSQYAISGGDGVPKYADNSAYVEEIYVDPTTNIITTKYYYWVMDKTSVDQNNENRKLPLTVIQDYILNPKNQGIAYAALISTQAIAFYNVSSYLSASDTIMHLDYQLLMNTDIIHSEYELVQKGNPSNPIPIKITNKLIDSLAGLDAMGQTVPDPKLSVADRYGISIRPRQTIFQNRLLALTELVAYVNSIFATNPIAEEFDLTGLNTEDPLPNIKLDAYDQSVDTEIELTYIDVNSVGAGYRVLVINDNTQSGLWVLYELLGDKTWAILQVQAYKASLYWHRTDWYASGYDVTTKPTFSVETTNDAIRLKPTPGDIIYIGNATGNNTWQLVEVNANDTFTIVGIQNGTIQLNSSLGDFAGNSLGFGNQDFDSSRYDQDPNIEIRSIITALRDDIFVNSLQGEFNNLFFVLVNYLLTEQTYVDWLFKSSFISITHKLRTLSQFPSYIVDNQTYYQNYIEEVKPYRTKIREYLIDYTGNDTYEGGVTDFDLPAYYDISTAVGIFRSPSGESPYVIQDEATWQTWPYNQWYNNRTLSVGAVVIENPGYGYKLPPSVTIRSSNARGTGATATAVMTGNVGNLHISSITVTNSGSGYTATPIIDINGSAKVPATAYATLKNSQVRNFDTTIKFDRISYNSSVQQWKANTFYTTGQILTYAQKEGNVWVRQAYKVNANLTTTSTFLTTDYTLVPAGDFNNANDRIIGYYQPTSMMPVVDTISVPITVANAAVNTNVIYVFPAENMITGMYISGNKVKSGYITKIVANTSITISNVETRVTQLTLTSNISLTTDSTITATYDSVDQLITGVAFPALPISGANFKLNPLFGRAFDSPAYDGVEYSKDGIALLSTKSIDSVIRSNYSGASLGATPETLNTVGGSYVDEYHSHAPEELVPGIVFDTLDMRIFTANIATSSNLATIGYRIFNNMLNDPMYLRISGANSTSLTQPLYTTDANVHVANAAVLSTPNPIFAQPGVVFINSERITYYTVDLVNNVLGQIRRGTQGTGVPSVHLNGTAVIDAGANQVIPGTTYGNLILNANVFYNSGAGTGTAIDGTGLDGSITAAAQFLKDSPTFYGNIAVSGVNSLVTENAINTLITEDGDTIYIEG